MRTQSIDTSPEFERVQIAHLRTFSPARKFASIRNWTHSIASMSRYASYKFPETMRKQDLAQIVSYEYGSTMAAIFQKSQRQETILRPDSDIQSALLAILSIFDCIGISYALTGSLACSVYGFHRSVQDVDILADVQSEHLIPFIAALQAEFMFDECQICEAVAQSTFFSMLHKLSLCKVDILLLSSLFEQEALQHRKSVLLIEEKPSIYMLIPEDVVLSRLVWYQQTGATADDQWNDIIGLLKIQAPTLNLRYLRETSMTLHVEKLLKQGLVDAGINEVSNERTKDY